MAWIESHQALANHPKVADLMAGMDWDLDTSLGKLHRFWWWCVDYAEDGDLRRHNDNRIGRAVGLNSSEDCSRFVRAMVESCWIDRMPYFRVHDWWDYIGLFLQRKYGEKNKPRWERVKLLYTGSTEVVQRLSQPTNQPNQPTEDRARAFKPEVRSEEATAHGAAAKAALQGQVTQAVMDRALVVLNAYPSKAKKDGRPVAKSLDDQNLLAYKIAGSPDHPWEEHAGLMQANPTPPDLRKWVEKMPDPVALQALRKATAGQSESRRYM